MNAPIRTTEICVKIFRHKETDAWFANSDDLRGLLVQAMTYDEVMTKVPSVIRCLLEARGDTVLSVELVDEMPPAFVVGAHKVMAQIAA